MNVHGKHLLLMALAGCATGSGVLLVRQADYRVPRKEEVTEEAERSVLNDAWIHMQVADNAKDSGNLDQARQQNKIAAEQFGAFADKFPSSEWRIVARRASAQRFKDAGEYMSAAAQAERMFRDPMATDVTRALAARILSSVWYQEATNQAKEGKVDRLKILVSSQRAGQPLKPRVPAEPWKRFIEWADAFAKVAKSDPVAKVGGDATPASQIALMTAEVEYASDNVEDARGRLATILETWPDDADAMDSAVPLYLETFLLKNDDQGYEAALARLAPIVKAAAQRAAEAAKAPAADEEKKKAAEVFARLDDSLAKQKVGTGFSAAARLFQEGKNPEAADAFEKFAEANKQSPDAPSALYNASIASDRAKDPARAEALRQKLLQTYPDAKVAPQATLMQASVLSRRGDMAGALKIYEQYLEKWPQGAQRCLVLQNLGYELDRQKKRLDAARRYQEFATDASCSKEDALTAAQALYRSGVLYAESKKQKEAKQAWATLAGMADAVGEVCKSPKDDAVRDGCVRVKGQLADARDRARKAK
jgi:tetratricopeptide (TPR) repeat protein